MRVLFTTPILEFPPAGGPQLRIENSLKALHGVCEVYLLHRALKNTPNLSRTENYFKSLCYSYDKIFLFQKTYESNTWDKLNKILDFSTSSKRSYKMIKKILIENEIKIIWFGYGNISFSLINKVRKNMPNVILICDTDSVWSRFILRELPYAKKLQKIKILIKGNIKKIEEKRFVKLCDIITAVSDIDAGYYRSLTKHKDKVKIFSNVIDLENYKFKVNPPPNLKRPAVYLAGTFGHVNSPMDTAARWVIKYVMPLVIKQIPAVHLYILGKNSSKQFGSLNHPNITVVGEVDSVLPYLQNIDVAIVPLQFESGTRFKILEAAACKIPIVTTKLGAEGIQVIDQDHVLIADSPENFAAAILRILDRKVSLVDLSLKSYELIKDKYSIDSAKAEAVEILDFSGKIKVQS